MACLMSDNVYYVNQWMRRLWGDRFRSSEYQNLSGICPLLLREVFEDPEDGIESIRRRLFSEEFFELLWRKTLLEIAHDVECLPPAVEDAEAGFGLARSQTIAERHLTAKSGTVGVPRVDFVCGGFYVVPSRWFHEVRFVNGTWGGWTGPPVEEAPYSATIGF